VIDPDSLTGPVLAALAAVPGITVYDGYVPDKVPETGGFIDPYVILWAGSPDEPRELTTDGVQDSDSVVWDFQTTTVAATHGLCREVNHAVTTALRNLRVRTGKVRTNPDGFNQQYPILDTQTSPARFMLPRQWRLITN